MSSEADKRAILLAASYPPREYKAKANSHEIAAAVKALAGAIFQQDWTLVFGGHPAVSPLILMIAREYGQKNRVVIYQSKYFLHHTSPATRALTEEGFGKIEFVPNDPTEAPPSPLGSVDTAKCPKSLAKMRERMISHPGIVGLVLIGGDTGIGQELDIFSITHNHLPIIPIGAPGGMAREMAPQTRAIGLEPAVFEALPHSRNYLTLCTHIVRYLASHY
jgi:hypothetical protein